MRPWVLSYLEFSFFLCKWFEIFLWLTGVSFKISGVLLRWSHVVFNQSYLDLSINSSDEIIFHIIACLTIVSLSPFSFQSVFSRVSFGFGKAPWPKVTWALKGLFQLAIVRWHCILWGNPGQELLHRTGEHCLVVAAPTFLQHAGPSANLVSVINQ